MCVSSSDEINVRVFIRLLKDVSSSDDTKVCVFIRRSKTHCFISFQSPPADFTQLAVLAAATSKPNSAILNMAAATSSVTLPHIWHIPAVCILL
jgi:hypothetical protein